MAELRLSPDGEAVAIRTNAPAEDWRAWGVMHRFNGGHWATAEEIADWTEVSA